MRFRPNEPHLDRELRVEHLKWPLYALDEAIVAPSARSSQLIRASGLVRWRAQGNDFRTFLAEFMSTLPQAEIASGRDRMKCGH